MAPDGVERDIRCKAVTNRIGNTAHLSDSRERYDGKIGAMVARWSARRSLPCIFVRASASERAGPGMERDRHMVHGAMGCMGRPASAIRPG